MATILQWNIRGLRCIRRDFDILVHEHQPDVICLQETKLEHPPPLSHYICANYDCYFKSLRRNPDKLPSGGVSIYIKKGLYHKLVQIDSHLQVITVQVTLGGAPITVLSVYIAGNSHLTTICWEISEARHLSWVTSMDTIICGAVMMMVPGVKSLRDSQINTICVFSMTEPTYILNHKPSMWPTQRLQ